MMPDEIGHMIIISIIFGIGFLGYMFLTRVIGLRDATAWKIIATITILWLAFVSSGSMSVLLFVVFFIAVVFTLITSVIGFGINIFKGDSNNRTFGLTNIVKFVLGFLVAEFFFKKLGKNTEAQNIKNNIMNKMK